MAGVLIGVYGGLTSGVTEAEFSDYFRKDTVILTFSVIAAVIQTTLIALFLRQSGISSSNLFLINTATGCSN
jgi:uncharacterized membrane protein YeiH